MEAIQIGCVIYTKAQAIAIMQHSTTRDMTYALAQQLIAAKLNVMCNYASNCIANEIAAADAWLCAHPVGSGVKASSSDWQQISGTHQTLDRYNNGLLCAPSCDAACPEWAGPGSVSSKQVKRSIKNSGATVVTMSGLTLSWPSTNGKLLKVKLDGDVVWDKKSPVGATNITITSATMTTSVTKKSINPGKTRVFTLEFEKNASTNLGAYNLTVNFGGCSLTAPPWQ